MTRRTLPWGLALLLLLPTSGGAQGPGLFVAAPGTGRPDCAAITTPVNDQTWCFVASDPSHVYYRHAGAWVPLLTGGGDLTATYLLQTPAGDLPNAQALSTLGTGLLVSTTGTGVLSQYPGASCPGQAIAALSASGVPTCVPTGGVTPGSALAGTVTISDAATTGSVVFGVAQSDATYVLTGWTRSLTGSPPHVTSDYLNKTTAGFDVAISAPPGAGNAVEVNWQLNRPGANPLVGPTGATGPPGATGPTGTGGLHVATITVDLSGPIAFQEIVPPQGVGMVIRPHHVVLRGPGVYTVGDYTSPLAFNYNADVNIETFPAYYGSQFLWQFPGVTGSYSTQVSTADFGQVDQTFDVDPQNLGFYLTATGAPASTAMQQAGSGYVVGDTVTDPYAGTLLATVTSVDGGGAVTGYTVTDVGTDQGWRVGEETSMLNTAPQSGIGTLFRLRITSVQTTNYGKPITTSIWNAGTGYAPGDTLSMYLFGSLRVTVTTVGGGGAVTGYTVTFISEEYDNCLGCAEDYVGVALQPGAGINFALRVDAIEVGTFAVQLTYTVSPAP